MISDLILYSLTPYQIRILELLKSVITRLRHLNGSYFGIRWVISTNQPIEAFLKEDVSNFNSTPANGQLFYQADLNLARLTPNYGPSRVLQESPAQFYLIELLLMEQSLTPDQNTIKDFIR